MAKLASPIHSLFSHLRFKEWWNHKIPPILAITFMCLLRDQTITSNNLLQICALLAWAFFAASFGYFLNDWTDQKEDKLAGKRNVAESKSILLKSTIIAISGLGTLIVWLLIGAQKAIVLLSLFHLLLFIFYSVPPVRLKTKYLFGNICDMMYAHLIPYSIAFILFSDIITYPNKITFILLISWSCLVGFRNILYHQWIDRENDLINDHHFLGSKLAEPNLKWVFKYLLFPLELILFFSFHWFCLYNISYFIAISLISILSILFIILKKTKNDAFFGLFKSLNFYYEIIWPIVLICALGKYSVLLLLPYLLLFPESKKWFFSKTKQLFTFIKELGIRLYWKCKTWIDCNPYIFEIRNRLRKK